MPHYICKGEGCTTLAHAPSVCLAPSCANRYKLLVECNCPRKDMHRVYGAHAEFYARGPRLNVVNFGIALGAVSAVGIFVLGVLSMGGFAEGLVEALGAFYIGYASTLLGSVAGALWALVDGFLWGVFFAWTYNKLQELRR